MSIAWSRRRLVRLTLVCAPLVVARSGIAHGQQDRRLSPEMRDAIRLDLDGQTTQARRLLQPLIDTVSDPAAKADAQRAMAMSYAFDGDCANTGKYESMVIAYWRTREQADPQNAFYQQGEMADEAARVCIDVGDLGAAERWYREGYALGVKEPAPQKHPKSLWDFRLAHALGRLAARRGDAAGAHAQIEAARRALNGDTAMAVQQERFFPYLVGYVALYTHDLQTAETQLTRATGMKGGENDPFLWCLLAMTDEQSGRRDEAMTLYRKALDLATAHNPASAYVRRTASAKLKLARGS
ncbi:MAG TPA: tetratricopeptide repeat protein [Gemmatimonadaceae bacterium]|nr:tetratricopeptide repeat protein [Gemmatimonadaceae bacterium]